MYAKYFLLFFFLFIYELGHIQAQNCGCIPLLYEGFDYTEGENMHQKVGGTGWSGGWESQVGDMRVGFRVGSNTMIYNDLRSYYKSFVGGHYWHRIGRRLDISTTSALAPYRKENGYLGKAGTTLWASAIFQKTQNNDEQIWFGLHNTNVSWYEGNPGTTNSRLLLGYFGAANSSVNGVRYWTVRIGDNYYNTNVPITLATPTLMIWKITFNANSTTLSLFINPTTLGSGAEPTVPSWQFTTTSALEFQHFTVYGDNNINNFMLDEIRFSSDYRCVAPDATINENQLPVARMSVSATSGIAPLSIQLNGATSSDPNGTLTQYQWTFGDGGTATGATTNYVFRHTGVMFARLTVTDDCGSTNSVSQNIVVTDANGFTPCLSAPVPEAFANCNGIGGGVIRLDAGLATTFSLTHENGTAYPFANSRFSNLPVGKYTLIAAGQNNCTDTFLLQMPIDSMNCPNVAANGNFQFGMGLEGLSYWDKCRAFKDFMKTSDNQILTYPIANTSWNTNLQNEMPTDTEGYPTVVPFNTSQGQQRARIVISAGGHLPIGEYLFLYDGVGQLYFRGNITTLSASQGRISIRVNGTENLWIDIESSTQGNHLRNFRLIRPQDETTYLTQPFYQPFLEKICQFNPIRFMDWQATNVSNLVNWSERGKPSDRSQTMRDGVSYEHIIQLANITNRDIWITIPHKASDDFIRQMARLFRNGLKTNIKVFLEYSNEVWNWQFGQAHWVSENGNQNISYPRRYTERSLNAFRIWHEEWGANKHRIKRVLATQTGHNWVSEQMLAQAKNEFDYFAPTFYFGYAGSCVEALRTSGANATATDVINCTRESMRSFFPNIRQTYRLAQMYGKPIAHYEGGQHMTSNPTIEPFQTALYAAQIDPQIRTLYQEMIDSLRRYGGTEYATAFVLTGVRESRYGSWGHIEDIDQNLITQPAPKYQVLLDNFRSVQGSCNLDLNAILDIEILDFQGVVKEEGNFLTWKISDIHEAENILLEKSENGTNFTPLSTLSKNLDFYLDKNIFPITYYRLKIKDLAGKEVYSKIISLQNLKAPFGGLGVIKIYPNPVSDILTIENLENTEGVEIINILGQTVLSFPKLNDNTINISDLENGIYFLKTSKNIVRFLKKK